MFSKVTFLGKSISSRLRLSELNPWPTTHSDLKLGTLSPYVLVSSSVKWK